jgi:AcrR family transcriptional regulator
LEQAVRSGPPWALPSLEGDDQVVARSTYHHGDLRAALVRAGLDAIADHGIAALSVADVARRTGVSPAAPYRHFSSRQALLVATATEAARQLAAELRAALEHFDDATSSEEPVDAPAGPAEALAATAAVYVRFLARRGAAFDLIFAEELADLDAPDLSAAGREVMDLLLPIALDITGQDPAAALDLLEQHTAAAHGYGALYRSGFLRRRLADIEGYASKAAAVTRVLAAAASS